MEYTVHHRGDKVTTRADWLSVIFSGSYNSVGADIQVAQFKLSDLEELLQSYNSYWHHPLNYNDSLDFVSAIKAQRLRASQVSVLDSRRTREVFRATLLGPEKWRSPEYYHSWWHLNSEKRLMDLEEDSVARHQPWVDQFIGPHWSDSTGLPMPSWNMINTDDQLVKFSTYRKLISSRTKNQLLRSEAFKETLLEDLLSGKLPAYVFKEGEMLIATPKEVRDQLSFEVYEEEEDAASKMYSADELDLMALKGPMEIRGNEQRFVPEYFWYGITGEKSMVGFDEPKLALPYDQFITYLAKSKSKALKAVAKLFKKDLYEYTLPYLEDDFGRIVQLDDQEIKSPYYYEEMIQNIPKSRLGSQE